MNHCYTSIRKLKDCNISVTVFLLDHKTFMFLHNTVILRYRLNGFMSLRWCHDYDTIHLFASLCFSDGKNKKRAAVMWCIMGAGAHHQFNSGSWDSLHLPCHPAQDKEGGWMDDNLAASHPKRKKKSTSKQVKTVGSSYAQSLYRHQMNCTFPDYCVKTRKDWS